MSAVASLGHGYLSATVKPNRHCFQTQKLKSQRPPKPISVPSSTDPHNYSLFSSFDPRKTLFPVKTAVDSDSLGSSDHSKEKVGARKFHFVVANAKFMLDEEEHFKEVLFERLRLFGERNFEQDFWLVIEPKFLDNFPTVTNRLRRPAVALVSTNASWITFMKLRLDRVLAESFEAESVEEALASNPTDLKFEKPENWVAPYPKYEYGWWEAFLPPGSKEEAKV